MKHYPMFPDYWEERKESDKVVENMFKKNRERVIIDPFLLSIKSGKIVLNNEQ